MNYSPLLNRKKIVGISLSFVLFSSCDCVQDVSGIVMDKNTKAPLEGAYTQKENRNHERCYTDTNGYFELNSISGGFRSCPPMEVAITKEGYEIVTVELEIGRRNTIYLERIK